MKILIANYEFPPLGGGASKVSYTLAKALVQLGHDVIVLTSRHGKAAKVESMEGMVVHRVWSWRKGIHDCGFRGAFTYLLSALPRLRQIIKDEDIDVVHYFFGLPTGLLSLYSYTWKKIPYIVSLRGSDVPLYDRDSKKLMFLHNLTRPLSRMIWRNAHQVFAVSEGLRKLAEATFPEVEVDVIYNGINVVEEKVAQRPAENRNRLRIICVSRLIPRKGVKDLLEALAMLSELDYVLVLIGTGPSEKELRQLAVEHGIADKVQFIGYCTPDEIERHYLESDVLVFPTHSDAFANVILEAMSAGLPVIATAVGGIVEAVIDGKTGILVDAGQPGQLAEAIELIAHDGKLRSKYGLAGQRRVRNMFAWDKVSKDYVLAYENALSKQDQR